MSPVGDVHMQPICFVTLLLPSPSWLLLVLNFFLSRGGGGGGGGKHAMFHHVYGVFLILLLSVTN